MEGQGLGRPSNLKDWTHQALWGPHHVVVHFGTEEEWRCHYCGRQFFYCYASNSRSEETPVEVFYTIFPISSNSFTLTGWFPNDSL